MTISTTSNEVVAQGNGATTSFSFNFPVPLAAYLFVYYTDATGAQTLLPSSSYSVTGIGTANGGSVTYPLVGSPIASGTSLTIQRLVPYKQLTDLVNQSGYYPNVVENALDYLTMLAQQLSQQSQLSLSVPFSAASPNLVFPGAKGRANQLAGFDVNGNAITYPISASVGAGNLVSEGPFVSGTNFTPGVTTTLTLSQAYGTVSNVSVHFDGTYQGTDQYTLNGTQITFLAPIPVGVGKVYIVGGTTISANLPALASVGDAQINWSNILNRVVDSIAALRSLSSATHSRVFCTGYYAPHDGGGGAYQFDPLDTTSADNGGTIIVAADGARWKLQIVGRVSIDQFGAKGDGVTDDTAAINKATAAVANLTASAKTYYITGALNFALNGMTFVCAGVGQTIFRQGTANSQVINNTGSWNVFRGFQIAYAAATPLSGATAIYSSGPNSVFSEFFISSCDIGIYFITGTAQYAHHFQIYLCQTAGIFVTNVNDIFVSDFIINAGPGTTTSTLGGIRLFGNVQAFVCARADVLGGAYSFTSDATTFAGGSSPSYCMFSDTYFDSAAYGSLANKLGVTVFANCWWSGGRTGVGYAGLTLVQTDSINFVNPQFVNNGGHGLSVTSGAVRTFLHNPQAIGNSVQTANAANGIVFANNTQHFAVNGGVCTNAYLGGTQSYGITIGTGCDYYNIDGVDLVGNGTGPFSDGSRGTSVNRYVSNLVGFKIKNSGNASIANGASSFAVNHGLPVTPNVNDISLTPTSPMGSNPFYIDSTSITATSFTVRVSTALTAQSFFNWQAQLYSN